MLLLKCYYIVFFPYLSVFGTGGSVTTKETRKCEYKSVSSLDNLILESQSFLQ